MKKTEWYPGEIKPVRKGWYEIHGFGLTRGIRFYWTGQIWKQYPSSHTRAVFFASDMWRGLTEQAA